MFALTADQLAVRDMAKSFADERIAPNALRWDETEHFPVDVLREAAALGMAAIYVGEQHGGSGMTRLDAGAYFEALSSSPSVASSASIQHGRLVVDGFGVRRSRNAATAALASMELIVSDRLTAALAVLDAATLTTWRLARRRRSRARRAKQFISGAGEGDLDRHGAHRRRRAVGIQPSWSRAAALAQVRARKHGWWCVAYPAG